MDVIYGSLNTLTVNRLLNIVLLFLLVSHVLVTVEVLNVFNGFK